MKEATRRIEKKAIEEALVETANHVTQAARQLNITTKGARVPETTVGTGARTPLISAIAVSEKKLISILIMPLFPFGSELIKVSLRMLRKRSRKIDRIEPSMDDVPMGNRAKDWFAQAERDVEQAKASQKDGRHEWACFAAHQAAEKAVKALHQWHGQEAWGHVVAKLMKDLAGKFSADFVDKAKVLDNHYLPTRYANGHPEGAPYEHYGPIQSKEAIQYAGEILKFVRDQMAKPKGS